MRGATTSGRARASLVALTGGYLLLAFVSAAPSSPLVPPLLPGAGPASWLTKGAAALGLDRLGRAGLTALSVATLALLLVAFGVLLREAWLGRAAVGPVGLAVGVGLALAVVAPVLLSRDAYSYAAYGRVAAVHGANPYLTPPSAFPQDPFTPVVSSAWRDTRSLYGPLFTLGSVGLVRTATSPSSTILGFKVLAGAAMAVAAGLAWAATGRVRPDRATFALAAVGLNPVLVVHTVGGAHNDALVAVFLAAAAWLAVGERRSPGGASGDGPGVTGRALGVTGLLALGALVKPPAAVALAVWLVAVGLDGPRRDRLRVIAGHLGVAAALGAAVTAPFFAGAHTVATFGTLAGVQGWASPARLVGRGAEALGDLVAAGLGDALRTAALAGFLALFAWGALRLLGRTGHLRLETQAPGHWAAGLLLFALAAPYLLPWYAAWFVPLLPLLAEGGLVAIGLAAAGVLALTGVPAEPGSAPALYRGMLLAVHYVAAPAMLVLFALALRRVTGPPFRTMAVPAPREAGQEPIDARPRPGP